MPAVAQSPPGPSERELVVVTRDAPPFAIKEPDGSWEGITIDLWRHVADQLHLRYRFVQLGSVEDLLHAVTDGEADVAAGALTVTANRRKAMDFTQPFFTTGLGVALPRVGITAWLPVIRTFFSLRFFDSVAILLSIALFVGILIWIFERHDNEHYGGGVLRGFVAGAWWSAIAMTQAGAAHEGPRSTPGRALAVIWMVASVITIAVFIAGVTSALTAQRLQGIVRSVDDLRGMRVGAVAGSSTVGYLMDQRIVFAAYPSADAGLHAVGTGQLDAFVYDRPLLAWMLRQGYSGLDLATVTLDRENYAFALPANSPLRNALDVAMLDTLQSEWWQQKRFAYFGRDSSGN
jgi:polar amino acid transport system substrate-binding protein